MSPIQAWWLAIRPRTLPAATAPVLVGSAHAYRVGHFVALPALAALIGALLIQIVSNLANDYFDFKKGADTEERLGPTRVTQAGLISEKGVLGGLVTCVLLAVLVGLYLVWVGGWPIVAVGVVSLICAIAYTGGPFPLGYNGLGELFVFFFFGPVAVAGTVYVQSLRWEPLAALAGVPIGLLCANILVVNNVRDVETDAKAGKRTLAVRFRRKFGENLYAFDLLLAALSLLAYALTASATWALLAAPVLLLARPLLHALRTLRGKPLNPILGQTAQLELRFALAMAIGTIVSAHL
ncbi:1,4-dihydroxy-2-naphthoate polyprenyltransferase [bacterium]|nr:MAG: 1,4-dihydroxy-2-naphthoate polyprenyltransferase [bacterium]